MASVIALIVQFFQYIYSFISKLWTFNSEICYSPLAVPAVSNFVAEPVPVVEESQKGEEAKESKEVLEPSPATFAVTAIVEDDQAEVVEQDEAEEEDRPCEERFEDLDNAGEEVVAEVEVHCSPAVTLEETAFFADELTVSIIKEVAVSQVVEADAEEDTWESNVEFETFITSPSKPKVAPVISTPLSDRVVDSVGDTVTDIDMCTSITVDEPAALVFDQDSSETKEPAKVGNRIRSMSSEDLERMERKSLDDLRIELTPSKKRRPSMQSPTESAMVKYFQDSIRKAAESRGTPLKSPKGEDLSVTIVSTILANVIGEDEQNVPILAANRESTLPETTEQAPSRVPDTPTRRLDLSERVVGSPVGSPMCRSPMHSPTNAERLADTTMC